ncbi:MAG: hypothetical protein ACLQMT_12155 [Candidatus Acidiferrales bacterium]
MGIDEKLRILAELSIEGFRALDSRLLAYMTVFLMVKQIDPVLYEILVRRLQAVSESEDLQHLMQQKYALILEVLKQSSDESQDQDLFKWFQEWKPEGPKN